MTLFQAKQRAIQQLSTKKIPRMTCSIGGHHYTLSLSLVDTPVGPMGEFVVNSGQDLMAQMDIISAVTFEVMGFRRSAMKMQPMPRKARRRSDGPRRSPDLSDRD